MYNALAMRLLVLSLFLLTCITGALAAGQPENAANVTLHSAWTAKALYFSFTVNDPDIEGANTEMLGQPWLDDAVAVYLNFAPELSDRLSDECLRIVISAAGGATVQRVSHSGWQDDPVWFGRGGNMQLGTIRYGVRIIGKGKINDRVRRDEGYEVEIGLPWKLLGVFPPADDKPMNIGFAAARYSKGEKQAIACWPAEISFLDLDRPIRWGTIQLNNDMAGNHRSAATRITPEFSKDAFIDGTVSKEEWKSADTVTFDNNNHVSQTPLKQGKQLLSVVAACYLLDPFSDSSAHQPLEPPGPWTGADSPYYHQAQLMEAHQAGIDAFAVVLPADPSLRSQSLKRLTILIKAWQDYSSSPIGKENIIPPLLFPVIDLTNADNLNLSEHNGELEIVALIEDFYSVVPPQARLMIQDDSGAYRNPIVLTNPSAEVMCDDALPGRIDAQLKNLNGARVGWIVDDQWKNTPELTDVLSRCSLNPSAGLGVGQGSLLAAVITPGEIAGKSKTIQRHGGESFFNNWQKIKIIRPDLVLINSWNDFKHETEIAASRNFGYKYFESAQHEIMMLGQARGFDISLISHNLPAVLMPGRKFSVELMVKNGGLQKIASDTGCQASYRITRNGETVHSGPISGRLQLDEWSTARLHFTFTTSRDKWRPLTADAYELHIDFSRSKIAILNSKQLTDKLGTIVIPFSISGKTDNVQVISSVVPLALLPGSEGRVQLSLRNSTKVSWHSGTECFRFRWSNNDDEPLPGETPVICPKTVEQGGTVSVEGKLPLTPSQPGFYHLFVDMLGEDTDPVTIYKSLVYVSPDDLLAEFNGLNFSRDFESRQPVEGAAALHNKGLTAWSKEDVSFVYQWLSWSGQEIPGTAGVVPLSEDVPPDGRLVLHFPILSPTVAGSYRIAFGLMHKDEAVPLISDLAKKIFPMVTTTVNAAYYTLVDLSSAYKVLDENGMEKRFYAASDGGKSADFDGTGRAFPLEEFLPDATYPPLGYQPGYARELPPAGSAGFHFPSFVNRQAPVVFAYGQEVALPEKPALALHIVAAGTSDPQLQEFIIQYADGTKGQVQLTVANWLGEPVNNEPVMLKSTHLHTASGDDFTLQGSLFAYKLALDPTRTPQKLILPKAPTLAIFAATLETIGE